MKFIILLISIILQAFLHIHLRKNKYRLIDRYTATMKPLLVKLHAVQGWGALIGLLTPILIAVLILNALFHYGILYVIYGVIILLLCLDIHDMKKQLAAYFTAFSNENLIQAQIEAEQFVNHTVDQNKSEMSRAITEAIFTQSLTNIFSVIFWFILLGPFGAVLYYLTTAIRNSALKPEFGFADTYTTADYLKELLDWLPARFVTLTFALTGHFGPVFSIWIDRVGGGISENRQMIIDSGLTALNLNLDPTHATITENHHALHLVNRTLWAWVIIVGFFTLASWL